MKKIKLFCCIIAAICLLTACQKNEEYLKLRQESFNVELGNPIVKEAICYLDLEGLSNEQISDIEKRSSMKIMNQESVDQGKYEPEGEYHARVQYQQEVVDFSIRVVKTRTPVILGPSVLTIEKGQVYDFSKEYQFVSYKDVGQLQFNTSKINFNQVGEYPMKISFSKQSDIQREVKVKIDNQTDHQIPQKVLMNIPYYNQLDVHAPNGCEATALYMGLKYKKEIEIDLKTFIDQQPRSLSPYEGFSGDPFARIGKRGDYYTIFPQPLIQYASQYAKMRDISGSTLAHIKDELANDHPVVVWVTGGFQNPIMENYYFGNATKNLHIVLLNGYDELKQVFYVQDPVDEELTEISFQQFKTCYETMKFAISIE